MTNLMTRLYIEIYTSPAWLRQCLIFLCLLLVIGHALAANDNPFAPPAELQQNLNTGGQQWWDTMATAAFWTAGGVCLIMLIFGWTKYLFIPFLIVMIAAGGDDLGRFIMSKGGVANMGNN